MALIHYSPLRYPGGKSAIFGLVSKIIQENNLVGCKYAEPYAGGCGLALSLLYSGTASEIHLNDLDRSIWAFWDSIINHTERFIEKINTTPVTIDEWHNQRNIQNKKYDVDSFDLGFSSFFLNRTNRSGIIIKAGVIGGLKQKSEYSLDCRFNKKNLIERITRIAENRDKIFLYNNDATDFIKEIENSNSNNTFLCIDPPYYEKGASLYTNFYTPKDHVILSNIISKLSTPWILTYDNVDAIRKLYIENKRYEFNLNYSAAKKRVGTELLVISNKLTISNNLIDNKLTELEKSVESI